MVDWELPIEAVHKGGAARLATLTGWRAPAELVSVQIDGNNMYWFGKDGSGGETGWTIRNVQPQKIDNIKIPGLPDTIPVNRELWERCVGLIRDLHADHIKHGAHDYVQDFVARTAEIAKLFPVEADPDEALAQKFYDEWLSDGATAPYAKNAMLHAIKRMREL